MSTSRTYRAPPAAAIKSHRAQRLRSARKRELQREHNEERRAAAAERGITVAQLLAERLHHWLTYVAPPTDIPERPQWGGVSRLLVTTIHNGTRPGILSDPAASFTNLHERVALNVHVLRLCKRRLE